MFKEVNLKMMIALFQHPSEWILRKAVFPADNFEILIASLFLSPFS